MSDSQKKVGALAVALVATLVTASTLQQGEPLQGQVSEIPVNDYNTEQSAAGVTIYKDAHNFVTCTTGGEVPVSEFSLGDVKAWIYGFLGSEPPFTGPFYISPAQLAVNPNLASINGLTKLVEKQRYYIMAAEDLYFKCGEPLKVKDSCGDFFCSADESANTCPQDCNTCGDGVVYGNEGCDDKGNLDGDGCDATCQIEVGYKCEGEPSQCSLLFPTLPGDDDDDGSNPSSSPSSIGSSAMSFPSSAVGVSSGPNSAATCQDTDGGHKPFEKGTATINGQSATDSCNGANELSEYNCEFGFMEGLRVDCEHGCFNGECLQLVIDPVHTICDNNQCIEVMGDGVNECVVDSDCHPAAFERGDVDGDGNVWKHDGWLLAQIIYDNKDVSNDILDRADLSNDSKVDVEDLAIMLNEILINHEEDGHHLGDVQRDLRLDENDTGALKNLLGGGTIADPSQLPRADIDGSGQVTPIDLEILEDVLAALSGNAERTGNLYVYADSTPDRSRQLLGGTLGESMLRLVFAVDNEAIDVTSIKIHVLNRSNTDPVESIDRLELYKEGASTPFAFATVGGCGNQSSRNVFCADMASQQFVVTSDDVVIVRPKIKTDVDGAVSGEFVMLQLAEPNATGVTAIEARGVDSSNTLVQNNGDELGTGEVFIGVRTPAPTNGKYAAGPESVTVHSKITSITNANPDANGSAVPTGVSPIGQFKFSAATNENNHAGTNDVVVKFLAFDVNATNVILDAKSIKIYNKSDSTVKGDCTPYYITGEPFTSDNISGAFVADCDLSSAWMQREIDAGNDETFVLEVDVVNPQMNAASASVLQTSLSSFTDMNGSYGITGSHIRWHDTDAVTLQQFDWVEYPETTVKSTSYQS